MQVDVLTLFPALFEPFLRESFLGIAHERGALVVRVHDLRQWTTDRHRSVDDAPYGGGPGMVMRPEPLVAGIEAVAGPKGPQRAGPVLYLSPQGRPLTQEWLEVLATEERLTLVCGRYEGVDQRALDLAVDEELSVGDYVLSGGEIPAMVVLEGVVRLLPGVMGNPESAISESFREDLLEGPHYTRPAEFRGLEVPAVLRSGDHGAIERWRHEQALAWTAERRPDLSRRRTQGRAAPGSDPVDGSESGSKSGSKD